MGRLFPTQRALSCPVRSQGDQNESQHPNQARGLYEAAYDAFSRHHTENREQVGADIGASMSITEHTTTLAQTPVRN